MTDSVNRADEPSASWQPLEAWPARWRFWVPLLLALVVGVAFQGTRGLTETSETRYAECAREMLVTGNWLEPQVEFQPHWTKPPMTYWLVAAGMKVFGVNAWGARLPGVAALLLATWAVMVGARRYWGERTGFAAGVVFALGFPAVGAYLVTTDIYVTAAVALAGTAFLFGAAEADADRRRRYAWLMWAAWGLGFLIKGPPALLPLLAIIPWNLLQARERRVPLADWRGLLCFAVVALPWYAAMVVRHPALLDYYIGTEIVARVSSDLGHNRAWYKAIEIFGPGVVGALGLFGPWAAVLAWRAGWNRAARWRELWAARDVRLLLVGWVVLPLVVFCLSRSKLHFYVLPLAAPLALLAGRVLATQASWRTFRLVTALSLVVFVGLKAAGGYWPNRRDMAALGRELQTELAQLPAGAPVVLWDEPTNHGVTFYLRLGRETLPERIAVGEKGKFETWTVTEFAERVRAGAYAQGAVLVVAERSRAAFEQALPGLPITEVRAGRYWRLVRLATAGVAAPAN